METSTSTRYCYAKAHVSHADRGRLTTKVKPRLKYDTTKSRNDLCPYQSKPAKSAKPLSFTFFYREPGKYARVDGEDVELVVDRSPSSQRKPSVPPADSRQTGRMPSQYTTTNTTSIPTSLKPTASVGIPVQANIQVQQAPLTSIDVHKSRTETFKSSTGVKHVTGTPTRITDFVNQVSMVPGLWRQNREKVLQEVTTNRNSAESTLRHIEDEVRKEQGFMANAQAVMDNSRARLQNYHMQITQLRDKITQYDKQLDGGSSQELEDEDHESFVQLEAQVQMLVDRLGGRTKRQRTS